MAIYKGRNDSSAREETIRGDQSSEYNKFSDQQSIKNLTLLKEWCEEKIMVLTEKQNNREVQA